MSGVVQRSGNDQIIDPFAAEIVESVISVRFAGAGTECYRIIQGKTDAAPAVSAFADDSGGISYFFAVAGRRRTLHRRNALFVEAISKVIQKEIKKSALMRLER